MIEYSQPNTHKEFHVGHGRNVCLGDSLSRILKYNGFQVCPVNYIGDEGTHVAKCLWQIKQEQASLPKENQVEWYGQRYVAANEKIAAAQDEDKVRYQKEISDVLSELEQKKGDFYDLWLESKKHCLEDFNRIYKWLDVHFDHFFFESEVSEESQNIVDEYIEKGIFKESQGAWGIDMEPHKLGFFMARKSDGTTLYITKDLALAREKFRSFKIDESLYVVGNEQNFHFQQLFKALEIMGFKEAKQCKHLSYGHVKLPSGKMSSRKGTAITFNELMQIMLAKVSTKLEKYQEEWSPEELEDTAHKLAVGAIKYGMLSTDPQKEIIFDADLWTSLEGNSGPYLMYSYARTQSILKKANASKENNYIHYENALGHETEQELLRYLYDFNETSLQAYKAYKPSLIAHHLYDM